MSDRYRKVRRELRRIQRYVRWCEDNAANRKHKRTLLYSQTMQGLMDRLIKAKREAS